MSDDLLPHIIEIKGAIGEIKGTVDAQSQKWNNLESWKRDTAEAIGMLKSDQDKAKGGVKILWFTVPLVSGGIGWLVRHFPGSG